MRSWTPVRKKRPTKSVFASETFKIREYRIWMVSASLSSVEEIEDPSNDREAAKFSRSARPPVETWVIGTVAMATSARKATTFSCSVESICKHQRPGSDSHTHPSPEKEGKDRLFWSHQALPGSFDAAPTLTRAWLELGTVVGTGSRAAGVASKACGLDATRDRPNSGSAEAGSRARRSATEYVS